MKERNSNFELMRIISMLFIILWHVIMHGNMIESSGGEDIKQILLIIRYLIIVHVNSFVLLSGYYQSKSKFKLSKLLSLFLQVVFYLNLIFWAAVKYGYIDSYNSVTILNNFVFSSIDSYWFMQTYIILYIFSDYINKFISRLNRREYKNLLILLFFVFSIMSFVSGGKFFANTGYNFFNFIFLYMIGAYLRMYPLKDTYHFKRFSKNGYMVLMVFIFLLMAYLNYSLYYFADNFLFSYNNLFKEISDRILYSKVSYATPFVVIQSICYFEIFRMIFIKSKIINFISSCTLGIYLFHENIIIRDNIYKLFKIDIGVYNDYGMLLRMICVMFLIFLIGMIIEIIRKLIFYLLEKFIVIKKIKLWLKKKCCSFNVSILWD